MRPPGQRARSVALTLITAAWSASCSTTDMVASAQGDSLACTARSPTRLSDGRCLQRLARALFLPATLCGCDPLSFSPDVSVDGFDSKVAAYAPGGGGVRVGANAGLSFPGKLSIAGDLVVAGGGLASGTDLVVGGNLEVGGSLGRPSTHAQVAGSASIQGDIAVATLAVGGTLLTSPGASVSGSVSASALSTGPVSVALPCVCGTDGGLDVAQVVSQLADANDDGASGFDPSALDMSVHPGADGGTRLALGCGRFFLETAGVAGRPVTVAVSQRAVLGVHGRVAELTLELAPGAELDLFVAGPLAFGPGALGAPTRPEALRIYTTAGELDLGPVPSFAGLLWAPYAKLTSNVTGEVFGALTVGSLIGGWNGVLAMHGDRAIDAMAAVCP